MDHPNNKAKKISEVWSKVNYFSLPAESSTVTVVTSNFSLAAAVVFSVASALSM